MENYSQYDGGVMEDNVGEGIQDYFYDPNSTCEGNDTETYLFLQSLKPLQTGILVSYLVTMVVGLAGNSLVIFVIARNSQIRNKSVANYYIWNLAFADFFFVLMMPLFCYATYFNDWPFGTVMCKLSTVLLETNRYASMYTLVALSFDRYLASFYNMGHLRTVRAGITVCSVIWVLCGTISIPYWIYTHADERQCSNGLPSHFVPFWTFFQLVLALLLPLALIVVSYVLLALRLHVILNTSTARSASVQRPSRKMLRTVLVIVIIFLVCQVPWHVREITSLRQHQKYQYNDCLPTIPEFKMSMYLNTVATILGFISSCCNPIVYGILNDNYRKQYKAVLCCCGNNPVAVNTNGVSTSCRRVSIEDTTQPRLPLVYRFQIFFHPPCFNKRRGKSSARHHKLSVVSQDCTMYRTAETEHIEMEVHSEQKV